MKEKSLEIIREKLHKMKILLAEMEETLNTISGKDVSAPPENLIPRIFVWYEIYLKDGIVDHKEFLEIGEKYGYDRRGLGGFFSWNNPSLKYVGIKNEKIALSKWAADYVETYKEWIEKNIDNYRKQ